MLKRGIVYIIVLCITFSGAFTIGYKSNESNLITDVMAADKIAIVNNDQGVKNEKGQYLFGDFLIDYVNKYNKDYDYTVTNANEAKQGMINGKYGGEIIIPSNLTKSLLSYEQQKPLNGEITYIVNSELSNDKYRDVDHFIGGLLNTFNNDLAYMYVFSVFDDLHYTQDGLASLEDNLQSSFDFIDIIHDTDITKNHKLQLIEDNTELPVEKMDYQTIEQSVSETENKLADVINVSKENTNNSILELTEDIKDYSQSNTNLNDELLNSSDQINTLDELLNSFELDDVEQKDFTDDFSQLIKKQIDDEQKINKSIKSSGKVAKKLATDAEELTANITDYDTNQINQSFINLIAARTNYYEQSQSIESCLASSSADDAARSCINNNYQSYQTSYNKYNNYLQDLVDEAKYHDDLVSNLNKFIGITPTNNESKVEAKVTNEVENKNKQKFNVPIKKVMKEISNNDVEDDQEQEQTKIQLENLKVTSQENGLASRANALIEFDIISEQKQVVPLTISEQNNIESFNLKQVSGNKLSIDQVENVVNLNGLLSGHYQLLLSTNRKEAKASSLNIGILDQVKEVNLPVASGDLSLDVDYEASALNYHITNNGSKQVSELNLISDFFTAAIIDGIELNGEAVSYDQDAEKINIKLTEPLENTKQVNLKVLYHDYQAPENILVTHQVKINDQTFTDQELKNSIMVTSELVMEETENIDPGSKQQMTYKIKNQSTKDYTLNELNLKVNSNQAKLDVSNEELKVKVNGTTENITLNGSADNLNLQFATPVNITANSEIEMTIPFVITQMLEEVSDIKVDVSLRDIVINSGETIQFNLNNSLELSLIIAELSDVKVEYIVDSAICAETNADLKSCDLEAGDKISRKIILNNKNSSAINNIKIKDNVLSSKRIITTSADTSYQVKALDSDEQGQDSDQLKINISPDSLDYNVNLAANSQGIITQELTVSDEISKESRFENKITVDNQGSKQDIFSATQQLHFVPIKLKIKDVKVIDLDGDDLISPNEQVIARVTIKNQALRANVNKQNITVNSNDLATVKAISAVDQAQKDVPVIQNGNTVIIDQVLSAGAERTITINLTFKDFNAANSINGVVNFALTHLNDGNKDDEYNWNYSSKALDYRQIALGIITGSIHGDSDTNYHTAIKNGQQFNELYKQLLAKYQEIDYINSGSDALENSVAQIATNTLSSEEIAQIEEELATGLNVSTSCTNQASTVCQLVQVYQSLAIDQLANGKEIDQLNASVTQKSSSISNGLEKFNNSIQTKWGTNQKQLEKLTDKQLPEMPSLSGVKDSILQVPKSLADLGQTQARNIENYVSQKDENYLKNQESINKFVQELQKDDTYEKLANDFRTDEQARHEVNQAIIDQTGEILPNSQIKGVANKELYRFIANPVNISDKTSPKTQNIKENESKAKVNLSLAVIILSAVIAILIIIYLMRYKAKE